MTEQESVKVEEKPKGRVMVPADRVKSMLALPGVRSRFEDVLGKRAPGFISSVISAVAANKQLALCEPRSVISAAIVSASMELPINSSLGMAHIVPYKGVAQFQIGWKGFIQLALRSGQYKTINLTPVLEGQIIKNDPFTGDMEFDPDAAEEDAETVGYLLYFRLLNGYEKYFYMTKEQCEEHAKKYSKSYQRKKGVWVDDFDAMALKTVAKLGLSKYGILSLEMQKAVEMDQAEVTDEGLANYIDNKGKSKSNTASLLDEDIPDVVDAEYTENEQ